MPLEHSASNAALRRNMRVLNSEIGHSPHVQSRAQAIAIALNTQRRAAKGRAMGGGNFNPMGNNINPIRPFSQTNPGMASPIPMMQELSKNPAMMRMSGAPGLPSPLTQTPVTYGGPSVAGVTGPRMTRASGGFNMAKGPNLQPPNFFERGESRDMMHGPILSSGLGRADTHLTKVPSGSYVLPASHIASMGQGNSVAGLKLAQSQFGLNGPYGIGAMKPRFGSGPPKPPKIPTMGISKPPSMGVAGRGFGLTSEGGARGHGDLRPVDVALSGGEYVIHPHVVRNIGRGSLENGHKILDAYVMHARKKEIETQKKLPPPAEK